MRGGEFLKNQGATWRSNTKCNCTFLKVGKEYQYPRVPVPSHSCIRLPEYQYPRVPVPSHSCIHLPTAGTVKDTVQYVCATFQENGYPNPSIDNDGQPAFILWQEFRSFKNKEAQKSNTHFSHQQAHSLRQHQTRTSHWQTSNS